MTPFWRWSRHDRRNVVNRAMCNLNAASECCPTVRAFAWTRRRMIWNQYMETCTTYRQWKRLARHQ